MLERIIELCEQLGSNEPIQEKSLVSYKNAANCLSNSSQLVPKLMLYAIDHSDTSIKALWTTSISQFTEKIISENRGQKNRKQKDIKRKERRTTYQSDLEELVHAFENLSDTDLGKIVNYIIDTEDSQSLLKCFGHNPSLSSERFKKRIASFQDLRISHSRLHKELGS